MGVDTMTSPSIGVVEDADEAKPALVKWNRLTKITVAVQVQGIDRNQEIVASIERWTCGGAACNRRSSSRA